MNQSDERKVTELETVLLVDIQEISNPRCFEWKRWKDDRVDHIVKMEAMSKDTDIQPVLLNHGHIETYRAYRIGCYGFDEPVFVKAPIPKIFMRLLDGLLSAYIHKIAALEDEIKRLRNEFDRARFAVPEPYRDALKPRGVWPKRGGEPL